MEKEENITKMKGKITYGRSEVGEVKGGEFPKKKKRFFSIVG